MSVETSAPRSRRAILAAALGGLGAVIVSRFAAPDPAAGADGDPVRLGGTNQGNHSTQINSLTGETAFVAHSHDGTGLFAESDNSTPSDFSGPSQKTGVIGVGGGGMPVGPSLNTDEIGVYGYCDLTPNPAGRWGGPINSQGDYGTGDY